MTPAGIASGGARRFSRWAWWLPVALLHLGALTVLRLAEWHPAAAPPRSAGTAIRLTLVPLPAADIARAQPRRPEPTPTARPVARAPAPRPPALTGDQAAAPPAPPAPFPPLAPGGMPADDHRLAAAMPAASAAASAPLNLALPRDYARSPAYATNPALNDVRANLPRSSFEGRIANELGGDGRWVEEVMDNNRRRLRRGNLCVNVERSRLVQNNPFNQSVAPQMAEYSPPYRCERR